MEQTDPAFSWTCMMAAREVFGFPEDAALRLTPGAGLEVVGMKELEEEGRAGLMPLRNREKEKGVGGQAGRVLDSSVLLREL